MTVRQLRFPDDFWQRAAPEEPQRFQAVIDAVEGLPKAEREIVNALFWEGISRQALCERLGIPRSTLDGRADKALEAVGRALRRQVSRGTLPPDELGRVASLFSP